LGDLAKKHRKSPSLRNTDIANTHLISSQVNLSIFERNITYDNSQDDSLIIFFPNF
jgi:hypothetical protein